MLHALELENFKAFGERARIPFAPITLIFGENSAGKSTILQALYLLKQTLVRRDTGALLLPRTENGIVDLGSFQEMLFDHNLERTLSIRVYTRLDRELGIEFSFRRPSLEEEVLLDQIDIYDGKSAKCIAKFRPLSTTEEPEEFWTRMGFSTPLLYRIHHDSPLPSKLSAIECVWLTKESEYWKSEFEWCKENQEEIRKRFETQKSRLEDELRRETDEEKDSGTKITQRLNMWYQEKIDTSKDALEFLSSDFDLETYISKRGAEEMNTVLELEGPLPVRSISDEYDSFIEKSRSPSYARSNDIQVFHIAELATVAGQALERTLEDLFPISPFRKPPERWYIFRGTSPQDVGYQGDLLPDLLFRRPEVVKEANEWLKRLEIDYELEVKPVGADSGDFFEVRLIDTRRKERVSIALPDVGFGVSQLLPFIVQSLVSEKKLSLLNSQKFTCIRNCKQISVTF